MNRRKNQGRQSTPTSPTEPPRPPIVPHLSVPSLPFCLHATGTLITPVQPSTVQKILELHLQKEPKIKNYIQI